LGTSAAYVTLHEGKYHQIKRMLASRGKPVTYLKRVTFGPLKLDENLEIGCWRLLTDEEKAELFRQ
jgi:16S rRNA pseudouridine516 synthase